MAFTKSFLQIRDIARTEAPFLGSLHVRAVSADFRTESAARELTAAFYFALPTSRAARRIVVSASLGKYAGV